MSAPSITFDVGTAYDFFISLTMLHKPSDYGLRPAWAAGMRSRLPGEERETLKEAQTIIGVPLRWIHALSDPKDGRTVLEVLEDIPAPARLPALTTGELADGPAEEILYRVAEAGAWHDDDLTEFTAAKQELKGHAPSEEEARTILHAWADSERFAERYHRALRAYYEVFFIDEEPRLRPALHQAVKRAQDLSAERKLPELLEELSQGIRLTNELEVSAVVLAPSFWITPLLMWEDLDDDKRLFVFGARPPEASLVPGEAVPESLLRALKALSVPTRLRVIRYLASESLTPTQLASRLRLRPSTLTHHLNSLRLAGLVQVTVDESKEKRYTARIESVEALMQALKDYLT